MEVGYYGEPLHYPPGLQGEPGFGGRPGWWKGSRPCDFCGLPSGWFRTDLKKNVCARHYATQEPRSGG
jgi:hypothetical protein